VLKTLPPEAEHSRYKYLAAYGSIIEFKTLQAAAEGIDDGKEKLIEGIIPRLSCDRAIRTRNIGSGRRGCGGWLKEAEG
jgi:hypothetical protein